MPHHSRQGRQVFPGRWMPHDELDRIANLERVYPPAKLHMKAIAATHVAGIEYLNRLWM